MLYAERKMRGFIVFSRSDRASMLIRQVLLENFGFEERGDEAWGGATLSYGEIRGLTLEASHLYMDEGLIRSLPCDMLVVASAHRSERRVRGLLTHATGNWGAEALHGGYPYALSETMAGAIEAALKTLHQEALGNRHLEEWQVGLEVTHHGPYSPKPLLYIEFGGDEESLGDVEAARAVAAACIAACGAGPAKRAAIGMGGNHYAAKFTRLALEGEYSFGHIAPRYAMPLRPELVEQALTRVAEKPRIAVLDWKNMPAPSRHPLLELLSERGIEVVKR